MMKKEGMAMYVPRRSWLAVGLLCLGGCGASEPSVSGTVLLEGQPILSGSIDYFPEKGTPGPNAGAVIERGQYRIVKGLTVGKYRVTIQSTRRVPGKKVGDPLGGLIDAEVAAVPEKYNKKTTLFREVSAGPNTFDFDLEGIKKGP
jgi:hypothetical protein